MIEILLSAVCLLADDGGLPAFPGAEGFGTHTPGGRGGRVMEVTTLEDGGPGSLRAAAEAEGPRLVVFRIGGTIEVKSPIRVLHPYLTLAGQTAPGGGITLKNAPSNLFAPLQIKTHDVVVRHLRSRPGPSGKPSENVDALTIADPERKVYNVVVDHCSFSWSLDEVVNSWYDARDITVQWCVMSEALYRSTQPKTEDAGGGKGPLFGGKGGGRVSLHHNLIAHNVGRNPMIKGEDVFDLVNNVIFIPRTVEAVVDGELGIPRVNFVGNTVLAPNGDGQVYGLWVLGSRPVSLFVRGNRGPHRPNDDLDEAAIVRPANRAREQIVPRRHESPAVTSSSAAALEDVLREAGCTRPVRDDADRRIVQDVRDGRARVVNDPSEVGGWPALDRGVPSADSDRDGMPDDWEKRHGFDPADPVDGARDADGDGYTNVEEFLNLTDPHRKG